MKSAVKRIKGILSSLMYVAVYYAVSLLVYAVYYIWNITGGRLSAAEIEKNANNGSFALTVITSIICLWIYMLLGKIRKKPLSGMVADRSVPPIIYFMAATLAIGCRFLVAVYYSASQKIELLHNSIERASESAPDINSAAQMLIAIFCVIVIAPLFEELLFRSLVMGELMKIMRPWAAITFQAIVFGAAHGVLFQSVFAFSVGIVLGLVYYRTQSIKTAAVCHGVFNFSTVFMMENMSVIGNIIFITAGILLSALSLFYIFANTKDCSKMN